MWGIIFSIISGFAMSVQGVFNTAISKKVGLWETTLIIQGIALITSLIIFFFAHDGNFRNIKDVNKFYLIAGVLGVIITFTVIKGMSDLGPAVAVSIILVSQLITAAVINHFGWFETDAVNSSTMREVIGTIIMIIGIVIFKWKR